MGIAGFSSSSFSSSSTLALLASPLHALQSFCSRLLPALPAPAHAPAGAHPALRPQRAAAAPARLPQALISTVEQARRPAANAPSLSRLKIVREFEAGVSPACAGRMVISGRMADVCAELDRMAQREAAGG